ncbi:MAG: universal stress protein [Chloroflexi bacterium]|uniref:Universal stress protein n=1 Tax=Candidatus Chlorohelix allophototropha TaxID=3003348 RepID=A0A8T7M2I9_9CHLR|nr:universal stress protein [Chloroflexota bacterium]WJW66049.1 universal stress protein [Chloroflexota bacterium L227-S17]
MFTKIIVPLDGSTLSEKALPLAVLLAAEFKTELLLLRVVEDGEYGSSNEARHYLENLEKFLNGQGLPDHQPPYQVRLLVANGSPVEQIVETVQDYKADLIVMSTHGRSGLGRLFSGNVASKVLHEVICPVLLIHPKHEEPTDLSEAFRLITSEIFKKPVLVPLDGSSLAEVALKPALLMAEIYNAPLHLIEVLPPLEELAVESAPLTVGGYFPRGLTSQELKEEALDYLLTVETDRLPPTHHIETHVVQGQPAPEIIRHAHTVNAGLIVMASHTRTGIGRTILGSVTEEVLRKSEVPVLIINRHAGHLEEIKTH